MPGGTPNHLSNLPKLIPVSTHALFFSPYRLPADVTHADAAPSTSRELLRHLGWLMDEVVRGSQEKVGLAQATYDSVRDSLFFLRSASPF
jgi:hypothetical protein